MHKDKLESLWNVQLEFNQKFFTNKIGKRLEEMTLEEKVQWSKNQILSITSEAMEVLNELPNWKSHRVVNTEFIPSNLYEEIIDVNKFSVGLAQIWGMTFEQYYEEYLRKSYVVEQRYHQEHDLKLIDKESKIAALDIDGVLGDYENWFLKYCKDVHNIQYSSIKELKLNMGLLNYENVKSMYRQSGWKATMPAIDGAAQFTKFLRENGYTIIILTARPYDEYYRIYPDTLSFLKTNNIVFDGIIFNKEKHLKIIKEFPNLSFMIEDNAKIACEVAELGYKVFYKMNKTNTEYAIDNKNKFMELGIETFSDFREMENHPLI